ncbi:MAG TPA: hypothetical protein VK469_08070 [Candidatus Kapabacteria bacterium]|nr:hypothetical protein [Candidatus Kapabacteria bacterium]
MAFDDLIGNKRIKNILTSYLRHNIVPYGMIFFGPSSSNLLAFARGFAKALNCLTHSDDFCDQCRNCIEADHDSFLDLRILQPDGQFYKKEQITYLVEDNFNRPMKGKKKIYILTGAHHMNPSSANAFLKVLEEPAPSNVFILLTDNLNGLLPTIKSRCQILKFSPLSKKEITEYLVQQGEDAEKAQLKAYLSQSNMESVLTADFDEFMKKRAEVLAMLSGLLQNRGVEVTLMNLFKLSRSREKFVEYFREIINLLSLMLRDIMILLVDPQNQNIINVDYRETLTKLSPYLTMEKTMFLIRKMEFLLRDIQRNLNTRVLIMEFMKYYTDNDSENENEM